MKRSKPVAMILFDVLFILGALFSLLSFYVGLNNIEYTSFLMTSFFMIIFYIAIWFFASMRKSNIAIALVGLIILTRSISFFIYSALYVNNFAKFACFLLSILFMLISIIAATVSSSREWRRQDYENIDEVFS
jgi:hypothetical protein